MWNYFKLIFHFLLLGNIYISLCAVGLTIETSSILVQPLHSVAFYLFIFFSTLFSYNLYYFRSIKFEFHKLLAGIGAAGALVSFACMESVSWQILGLICIGSSIYLLPVLLARKVTIWFSFIKLFLLIVVWVLLTFMLPIQLEDINSEAIFLLGYRLAFMSILCLLFFRKDAKGKKLKNFASFSIFLFLSVQFFCSLRIGFGYSMDLGIIYILMTIFTLLISIVFISKKKRTLQYQIYVDGMMLLQFVLVYLHFHLLS